MAGVTGLVFILRSMTIGSALTVKGGDGMEQIIEMLAHIEMCVTGMTICIVLIMVATLLTAVNSFFK